MIAPSRQHASNRSGAALLLCLAIILIISATTTIALQQFRHAHLSHSHFQEQQSILRMVQDQINWSLQYFARKHDSLSLPLDNPLIVLRDDHIVLKDQHCHVHVQAFDAHAGIPAALLQHKGQHSQAIQQLLPQEFRFVSLQNLSIDNPLTDQATIWLDTRLNNDALRFPEIVFDDSTSSIWHGGTTDQSIPLMEQDVFNETNAAWITWVNCFGDTNININTCPEHVLAWALSEKQLDQHLDTILAARAEGTHIEVPKNPRTSNTSAKHQQRSFGLSDTSTRWVLDIRIKVFQQVARYLAVIDCEQANGLIQLIDISN